MRKCDLIKNISSKNVVPENKEYASVRRTKQSVL